MASPLERTFSSTPLIDWAPECQSTSVTFQEPEDDVYKIPNRRWPPFSPMGQERITTSVDGHCCTFVSEQEMLDVHPMKFLPFPFKNRDDVLAVTRDDKHVLLQQSLFSCAPTAIAMIALDLNGHPNIDSIGYGKIIGHDQESYWIRVAGFAPIVHEVQGDVVQKAEKLTDLLKNGPGILHLFHPELKGHCVVLDEVVLGNNSAIIRDPYHGMRFTMKLVPLMQWAQGRFVQLQREN